MSLRPPWRRRRRGRRGGCGRRDPDVPRSCGSRSMRSVRPRPICGVHGEAHGAARLAPLQAGGGEDLVQPLCLRLRLHAVRTRHRQSARPLCTERPSSMAAAARKSSIREFVQLPRNTVSTLISRTASPPPTPCRRGHAGPPRGRRDRPWPRGPGRSRDRRHLRRVGAPGDVWGDGTLRRARPPCRRSHRRRWAACASTQPRRPSRHPRAHGRACT